MRYKVFIPNDGINDRSCIGTHYENSKKDLLAFIRRMKQRNLLKGSYKITEPTKAQHA